MEATIHPSGESLKRGFDHRNVIRYCSHDGLRIM
jgi:hypothetical protein